MELINKGIDDALKNGLVTTVHVDDSAIKKVEEIHLESIKTAPTQSQKALVDICAVLENLYEKAKVDPGFLFSNEILEAAASLKQEYPAEWARLHKNLKEKGVAIAEFKQKIRQVIKRKNHDANKNYETSVVEDGESKKKFKPYEVRDGRIVHNVQTEDGVIYKPLCNFSAKIISEEVRDDGIEQSLVFSIDGALQNGSPLSTLVVAASNFPSLNWVINWGMRAIILSGMGTKDHLRVAIQIMSSNAERRTVYTHVGWRKIEGHWFYLHAGGAIGINANIKICVSTNEANLGNYMLPVPPVGNDLKNAVLASLKFLTVSSPSITFPIFAAIYRAVLAEIVAVDFSVFISGPSGNQKSELTAMVMAHFGEKFNRLNLPANWSSTENTLERQACLAKDAVLVIDDFIPGNGTYAMQALHQKADRVLRSQGNRSGRGRMRADGSLRPANPPRGLIMSSGEDTPRGFSLKARLMIIDIEPGSVNLNILTELQNHATSGLFVMAMSAFIQYISENFEALKKCLPNLQNELRAKYMEKTMHNRTPDIVASLMLGLEVFTDFCVERRIMDSNEKLKFCKDGLDAIMTTARCQGEYQSGEDSTQRFCELLRASLTSGHAYIANANDGSAPENASLWGWEAVGSVTQGIDLSFKPTFTPKGDKIGWLDKHDLLLDADATFAIIQRLARDQGDQLSFSKHTIIKRLVQKGIAQKSPAEQKNVTKRSIEGARRSVLIISSKLIIDPS